MPIRDLWRSAIKRIAHRNEMLSQRVAEEQQRLRDVYLRGEANDSFSAELRARLRQLHEAEDILLLEDCVIFEIWAKLRRAWGRGGTDPFLGISDLRAYLQARRLYEAAPLTEFLATCVNTADDGDLRSWLRVRRYTDEELDHHLLEQEIEECRRTRFWPDRVATHLVRQSLTERGVPIRLLQWGHIVADCLLAGTCDCVRAFMTPETQYRGFRPASERCSQTHFLRAANLKGDALAFVHRAVTGGCTAFEARGCGQSIFANVFDTPSGGKLRLAKRGESYHLTDTGHETRLAVVTDFVEPESPQPSITWPCLGCLQCQAFVPNRAASCLGDRHVWLFGRLDVADQPKGDWHQVQVDVCQARHLWPSATGATCPVCGQAAMKMRKVVRVFCPTHVEFEEVDWCFVLPGSPPSTT